MEMKDLIKKNQVWARLPKALEYFDGKRFYYEEVDIEVEENEEGEKEILVYYKKYIFVVEEQTLDAFFSIKRPEEDWTKLEWRGTIFWKNAPEEVKKIVGK